MSFGPLNRSAAEDSSPPTTLDAPDGEANVRTGNFDPLATESAANQPTAGSSGAIGSAGRSVGPQQIGKYRVIQLLGAGGQATVYRAVHTEIPGRDVVIKWANANLSPDAQRCILDEGRILAELDHPGLVRVYDVDVAEGRPYVVFEYVAGRTLRDEAKGTTIAPQRAAEIVSQLADTLEQAHRRGVLHRDLKPANILIDAHARPRVLDFGLGTSTSVWLAEHKVDAGVSGTLAYMAPEQAIGEPAGFGPWTDVFGLGAILYELLTGRPPHDLANLDVGSCLDKVEACKIPAPRSVRPTVPQALEEVVLRALAHDPQRRYRNMAEFKAALDAYLAPVGHTPATGVGIGRPSLRRRPALIAAVAGAAALALFFGFKAIGNRTVGGDPAIGGGTSPTPMIPTPVESPLAGSLNVRVWSADAASKRGIPIGEPGALPIVNGEQVHIEASLNRPAHLYVLWIDADGKVTRLDDTSHGATSPRNTFHSPAALDKGWEIVGNPGLETVVLVAADHPPTEDPDFVKLVGTLPPTGPQSGDGYLAFDVERKRPDDTTSCVRVTGGQSATRGLGEIKTINDPVVQTLEKLRQQFDLVKAIRFAHR
jgi:tRNA A-37 threonylcarbamoyl transferase component Bud32